MSEQRSTVFIIVAGLSGAGKSTFIRTLSEGHPFEENETATRQVIDGYQLDYAYGQIKVDDSLIVRLLAPPTAHEQKLASHLPENTLGVIVLVDSSDREQLPAAQALLAGYQTKATVPFVVGATRQDWPGALPPDDLRASLDGVSDAPIVPCVANDLDSVTAVVIQLLHLLVDAIEAAEKAQKMQQAPIGEDGPPALAQNDQAVTRNTSERLIKKE